MSRIEWPRTDARVWALAVIEPHPTSDSVTPARWADARYATPADLAAAGYVPEGGGDHNAKDASIRELEAELAKTRPVVEAAKALVAEWRSNSSLDDDRAAPTLERAVDALTPSAPVEPNVMDAPGGPTCWCGNPSALESGACMEGHVVVPAIDTAPVEPRFPEAIASVAASLPTSEEDERAVDALVAKKMARVVKPMQREEKLAELARLAEAGGPMPHSMMAMASKEPEPAGTSKPCPGCGHEWQRHGSTGCWAGCYSSAPCLCRLVPPAPAKGEPTPYDLCRRCDSPRSKHMELIGTGLVCPMQVARFAAYAGTGAQLVAAEAAFAAERTAREKAESDLAAAQQALDEYAEWKRVWERQSREAAERAESAERLRAAADVALLDAKERAEKAEAERDESRAAVAEFFAAAGMADHDLPGRVVSRVRRLYRAVFFSHRQQDGGTCADCGADLEDACEDGALCPSRTVNPGLRERIRTLEQEQLADEVMRLMNERSAALDKPKKPDRQALVAKLDDSPIPMRLPCPECGALHIDEGEFATKRHHTHSCQKCGLTWRPAVVATVGVRFLPGFRNENHLVESRS